MKYVFLFIFVSLMLVNNSFYSQTVTGKLTNEKGKVLPFGNLYLKKSKQGTQTNLNGNFELKLKINKQFPIFDTLIVSYIGYDSYKQVVQIKKGNTALNIVLSSSIKELNEFQVTGLKIYPPEEIVKFAIKNQKKNYINKFSISNGFYRELIKEDENWIMMNEASIQLKYSSYPQKRFLHKAFKSYYKYDSQPWNLSPGTEFKHMLRFTSFIPIKKDQVKIVSSRVSQDLSKYKTQTAPVGGPGDLVALDKLKYMYDFFDQKMMKEYNYKLIGEIDYKGELCYIIDFHPKQEYNGVIFQPLSKKMQHPIYLGRIYITGVDFAVVNFEFQLANNLDFSIYSNRIGIVDYIKAKVDYEKFDGKWMLSSVETEQRKENTHVGKKVTYSCFRSLQLEKPSLEKVKFNRDSIAYITKSFQLRFFSNKYNTSYWNEYEKTKSYSKLPSEVLQDLEKQKPLQKQFEFLNIPIDSIDKPKAKKQPYKHFYSSDTLKDEYNWLTDRNDEEVLKYLQLENKYYADVLYKINDSIKGFHYRYNNLFIPIESNSTNKKNKYFKVNKEICLYKRDVNGDVGLYRLTDDSTEILVLNLSKKNEQIENFNLEDFQFSDLSQFSCLYSEKGGYTSNLVVQDVFLDSVTVGISSVKEYKWVNDSTIIYLKADESNRTFQLRSVNVNSNEDKLVYEEKDKTFDLRFEKASSGRFDFLVASNLVESEYYYFSKKEKIELNLIQKRIGNHYYEIDHKKGDYFYGSTNRTKEKSEIVKIEIDNPNIEYWNVLYSTNNPIEDFYLTDDFIAIKEFNTNTLLLKSINLETKKVEKIKFKDEISSFYFDDYSKDSTNIITIEYTSPTSPYTAYQVDLPTRNKTITQNVELKFNNAAVKTIYLKALDGTKIPITVYYQKELETEKIRGVILKAYGAYGYKQYADFSDEDKVYVDLGFVVAYAHVRGGGEYGSKWHDQGRLKNKKQTFDDYISCAKFLTSKYKIKPKQLTGIGASAGGLIMGYVANNYPDLFGTLIFDRPYLDVINTMTDSTLSLTTMEYKEWGNPSDSNYYNYIKSYSPYQNIKKQGYPNMLFFAGYNDIQTPYWQIAKSVAMYRENNTSNSLILFNTNMSSGHRGSVNSSDNTKNLAAKYSIILQSLK